MPTRTTDGPHAERLLTPRQACERLGLTERQLRRQLSEGRLEVVKVGRLNRFREAYIDAFVRANTRAPEND